MLLVLYFDVLLPLFVKFWRFHGKFNWFWFDLLNPGVWSFVDYNLGSWPCRYSDIKHPLDVERRPLSFCHSGSGVLLSVLALPPVIWIGHFSNFLSKWSHWFGWWLPGLAHWSLVEWILGLDALLGILPIVEM